MGRAARKAVAAASMLLVFAGLLVFAAPCAAGLEIGPFASHRTDLDLNGPWEFAEIPSGFDSQAAAAYSQPAPWYPATVPGCVHTDLLANGLISDPFVGRNELLLQWIEDSDWAYRRRFTVTKEMLARKQIDLVCEGLDTIAIVKLNGAQIGHTDNMLRRWIAPVKSALREGENTLEITFLAPLRYLDGLRERRYGPMPAMNDPIGGSPFFRKAPYQFGWDWAPRYVTCGVWRPIRIIATDLPRMDRILTQQRHRIDPASQTRLVDLDVTVETISPSETPATLRIELDGKTIASERVTVAPGAGRFIVTKTIASPELWWPAGYGKQPLHELSATLLMEGGAIESAKTRIGFREVRLETRSDDAGESFVFVVNGQPVFCKGANWIPADSFPSRVSEARYRDLLGAAAACNMNMLRVWGGGVYEADLFYDLCDELGLMVWQDFMFSCSLYPADRDFLENVRAEASDNIRRLINHPSIVMYCGNNECEMAAKQYAKNEPLAWARYAKLFHELLPETCEALDPGREYWPSSPRSAEPAKASATAEGDIHAWSVWHGAKPFEDYESIAARFVSEFGFQSFPSMRTIRAYADNKDLNLTAPDIEHHQKNVAGNKRILLQMMDRFHIPTSFENFVILSQLQQALAMQIGVEHWRRSMPTCMGTLFWQLNDCWPVASWSSIDYFGRWKALQYFARRFYEPFHISATKAKEGAPVSVYATFDTAHETTFTLAWALQTYAGEAITTGTQDFATTKTGSMLIAKIATDKWLVDWDEQSAVYPYTAANTYLTLRATDGAVSSRNVFHFALFKQLDLPKPNLKIAARETDKGCEVTVAADVFAKWVWLEAAGEKAEGRFSDNFFDLDPGESRTVTYNAPKPERFVARSLVDTYKE